MTASLDIVAVLPGAASLGAYQAGAAAALVAGRNALVTCGVDARIPALGGASAGATVALLAGHALAHGLDPVALLREAWVDHVDLDLLVAGKEAPLGQSRLRKALSRLLSSESGEFTLEDSVAPSHVKLHIALTSLRGHRYQLANLGGRPVAAVTYADGGTVDYPAGSDPRSLVATDGGSALDLVIASTANPVVFPPQSLRRSPSPESETEEWWFTDGGLVQSRPIHRTLDLVAGSDRPLRCVVIDPRSEGPSSGEAWVGASGAHGWMRGLVRALSIFPAQVLSDELRRIDEENRSRRAIAELAPLLAIVDTAGLEAWAEKWDVSLDGDEVTSALTGTAGVSSTRPVPADVIHPLLVADGDDVERLLAGDILGDFGGFLSRELRANDFALGFVCMRQWWERTLPEHGLAEHRGALDAYLDRMGPPPWSHQPQGGSGLGDVPWRSRLQLLRVALRALRAALRG